MSDFRLLVSIHLVEFLRTLRRRDLENLLKRFRDIAAFPSNFSDFTEHDASGRRLGVHIYGKFAIKFWADFADRDLKVVDLHRADRPR